jgi:Fe-S-cluster-containing dehydrogenase component/CRP-like cAMP-binding protein
MAVLPTRISRPHRWDVPFGSAMADEDVDRLLARPPLSTLDSSCFPSSIPLRGVLLNDTRLRRFERGDIIVREGDYGNSAFFVLSGSVRVILNSLPSEMLGRRVPNKKSLFGSLAQLWRRPAYPEVRDYSGNRAPSGSASAGVQARQTKGEKTIHLFLQDVPRVLDANRTVRLETGELFGEIASLSRTPRTATVIAEEPAELLEIRWQGLRELRRYAPQWKEHIDRLYRQRSLLVHLQETSFLAGLPPETLQAIADQTQFKDYGEFEWNVSYRTIRQASTHERLEKEPVIAQEGDYPNGLILIRSGFARLSRHYNHGERTIRYLGKGEVFGLPELLGGAPGDGPLGLQFSLRAIGHVDVLIIPTAVVEQFIAPRFAADQIAALRARMEREREIDLEREAGARFDAEMVEFLVEERYANGTATMLIDLDRCTRCDDCVRACAATHDNNPKFIRHGRERNGIMVANACMHCVDPVCMIGCPTGAIHRESMEGQVVINDLTCIGCATCANSCPYDNIQMVEIRDRQGEFIVDVETQTPILKASKCDLCLDQLGGPACVRACPHDALIRADMRDTDKLSRWLNR